MELLLRVVSPGKLLARAAMAIPSCCRDAGRGRGVGTGVGFRVGTGVGNRVGTCVGNKVGDCVGCDGACVGAVVGGFVDTAGAPLASTRYAVGIVAIAISHSKCKMEIPMFLHHQCLDKSDTSRDHSCLSNTYIHLSLI